MINNFNLIYDIDISMINGICLIYAIYNWHNKGYQFDLCHLYQHNK